MDIIDRVVKFFVVIRMVICLIIFIKMYIKVVVCLMVCGGFVMYCGKMFFYYFFFVEVCNCFLN